MIDYSLYLCTNSDMNDYYSIVDCVEQAILGGVTFVQVREKNKTYTEFLKIAQSIKKVTDKYNIPLVINDNVDIAVEINADGVHIGQNDESFINARKKLGDNKIIGVSVSNLLEAKKAIEDGASYLGVGAIYKSTTKKDAKVVSMEELSKIVSYSKIPVVVIGGINCETIPKLSKLNIDGYAMIRPIIKQYNILETTKKIKMIVDKNIKSVNMDI